MALSCTRDKLWSYHKTTTRASLMYVLEFSIILKVPYNLENVAAHGIGSFIDHEMLCKHNFVHSILY